MLLNQRTWLKEFQKCDSKECVKEALQSRIAKISSLGKEYESLTNVWTGTWTLRQNLYNGSFVIKNCNKNNVCEIQYSAELAKSEFNDIHICKEVSMRLKIKNNKAVAYYKGRVINVSYIWNLTRLKMV